MRHGTAMLRADRLALEARLATPAYAYSPGDRDRLVEAMEFPLMVGIFQRLTLSPDRPPTQRRFTEAVAYELGQEAEAGVLGRARRTWPSFVVQHHATVTCQEVYPLALWVPRADTSYGIDVLVMTHDWRPVGLQIRTGGAASDDYAMRKVAGQAAIPVVIRELVCDPHEHPVGPFWLLSRERLEAAVEDAALEARTNDRNDGDRSLFWEGYEYGLSCAREEGVGG